MNPFDGKKCPCIASNTSDAAISHKTAHAGPWLDIQVDTTVYEICLQARGTSGILHFLSNDDKHDCSFHRAAILGIRLYLAIPQPFTKLQPYDAYGCRRAGRWFAACIATPLVWIKTLGCHQDSAANKRYRERQ